jgi:electron transfer flavoprotein beta subunit
MNILVAVKLVPDLVEELEIAESGDRLDTTWLRFILNEPDDHAIEQAVLLKERGGGKVTVLALDAEGIEDILYAASAKGADRLIKLTGSSGLGMNNHALARAFREIVSEAQPDLVLTGVQAHDDLDGAVGPLLAELMGMPYVGYVSGVTLSDRVCTVRKEYPGGLVAEMNVALPAVLGIQAAEEPPRYVAISRVRQAMTSAVIEHRPVAEIDLTGGLTITRMYRPESAQHAAMLEGDPEEIAAQLVHIFRELGVLQEGGRP